MFTAYAYISFFASLIDGKMISYIGGMGFSVLLPVDILASVTYGRGWDKLAVFVPLYFCLLSFFLKRLSHWEIFDFTFAAALVPAYLLLLKFIAVSSPAADIRNNSPDGMIYNKCKTY